MDKPEWMSSEYDPYEGFGLLAYAVAVVVITLVSAALLYVGAYDL